VNADIICSVPGGVQVCDLVGAGHAAGTAVAHSTLESTVGSVRSVMSVLEQLARSGPRQFDYFHWLIWLAILWVSLGLIFMCVIVVPEVWRLVARSWQNE